MKDHSDSLLDIVNSLTSLLLCLLFLCSPSIGRAADRVQPEAATIPVHYDATEIGRVVDAIARATGESFIYGDDLKGRVSVTVPSRVTPGEALELLNALLFLKGFSAIPMGQGVNKIVKSSEVSASAPRVEGQLELTSSRPVTTLIKMENVQAESVVTGLSSLTAKDAVVLGYPLTNSIIFAGSEGQVARLLELSRLIDRSANENVMVRSLRHRSSSFVEEVLAEVIDSDSSSARSTRVWNIPRSNQIVVQSNQDDLQKFRAIITNLDQPPVGGGGIEVVRVLNRDVIEVSDQLNGMNSSRSSSTTESRTSRESQGAEGESLSGRSFQVTPDEMTQSLILVADPDTMQILKSVIADLDKLPARIAVDVIVMEVRKPTDFAFGVDYFLPFVAPSGLSDPVAFAATGANVTQLFTNPLAGVDTGVPSQASPDASFFGRYARSPVQIPLLQNGVPVGSLSIPREQVAFEAKDIETYGKILLKPHIIVLSGEEHEIFAGDNIPIPVSNTSSAGGSALGISTSQSIERTDVGVTLRVKPRVGEAGVVDLDLDLTVSALGASVAGSVSEVGPTLLERKITTRLSLREGENAIIGGGIGREKTQSESGVPFLKDIPGLGFLFRSVQESTNDVDLIIMASAHVMRTQEEQVAESVRRRLAMGRSIQRRQEVYDLGEDRFAVLLDTVSTESKAKHIAESLTKDGFKVRLSEWDAYGQAVWDIYLVEIASLEQAGALARSLHEAGWSPEITSFADGSDPFDL